MNFVIFVLMAATSFPSQQTLFSLTDPKEDEIISPQRDLIYESKKIEDALNQKVLVIYKLLALTATLGVSFILWKRRYEIIEEFNKKLYPPEDPLQVRKKAFFLMQKEFLAGNIKSSEVFLILDQLFKGEHFTADFEQELCYVKFARHIPLHESSLKVIEYFQTKV